MIDINDIGTTYTIMHNDTGQTDTITVIFYEELMRIVGEYDPNHFPHFDEYLDDISTCLHRCADDVHEVSWYTTLSNNINIYDAVLVAMIENNRIVVIEKLPVE